MLSMVATGLILRFVLPAGSGRQALTLWGWDRHDWGDTHFWLAVSLVGSWACTWPCIGTGVRDGMRRVLGGAAGCPPFSLRRRTAIGMGFLAVMAIAVGEFLVIAVQSTTSSAGREKHGRGPPVMLERHASDLWGRH